MKNLILNCIAVASVYCGNVALQVPSGVEMEYKIKGPVNCEGEIADKAGLVQADCNLTPGSYELRCIDSFGDGWQGGFITINGKNYCKDFTTGHQKVVQVTI